MTTKAVHSIGGKVFILHTIYPTKQQADRLRNLLIHNNVHVRVIPSRLGYGVWMSRVDWLRERDRAMSTVSYRPIAKEIKRMRG